MDILKPVALTVFMALLCVLASSSTASAQETAEQQAGALYQRGLAEAEAQNYPAAAALFVEAWNLDSDPSLAFNAGRAFENNGDFKKARLYYKIALSSNPPDEVRKRCEASLIRIDRAEARIKEQLEASKPTTIALSVSANVTGSDVYIDGKLLGQAPVVLELPPGSHAVEVRQDGYLRHVETIAGEAGEQLAVVAELEGKPVFGWVGWTGIGLVAVGAGIGAAGIFFEVDARDAHDEAQTLEAVRDRALFEKLRDDGEADKGTAQVLYGSGIAIGAVGLGLVLADLFSDDEEPPPGAEVGATRVLVGPGQAAIEVVW